MSKIDRLRYAVYTFLTLKRRIIILFVTITLAIFGSSAFVSYYAISSILTNRIQEGIESNLIQMQISLQNTLSNLNHVSQQLALQGSVGMMLEQYLTASHSYEQYDLLNEMKTQISLIAFTNPSIGLLMYYFEDDNSSMLENSGLKDKFSIKSLPKLAEYYNISYYGPHISNDRFNNQYVLSVLRKIDLSKRDDVYIYIETSFKLTQSILQSDKSGVMAYHLMVDNDGRVAYSENLEVFPVNTFFPINTSKSNKGQLKGYYWFRSTSNQGWSIVSVISKEEYNREKNRWIGNMALLLLAFIPFSLFVSLMLWRMVYVPLKRLNKEIEWIGNNNFHHQGTRLNIPEFNNLLDRFQTMKRQIIDLIKEVEYKEKKRADSEVEKLRYKINPHFLMNTLNTVHWLAVMNNQSDIDQMVQSLNKLLSYNLGKMKQQSTIKDELEALKEYLNLQQKRYEFNFSIIIDVDEKVLNTPIPRFVLQPLAENAIYHGINDNGHIAVSIKLTDGIEMSVSDNGSKMTQEIFQKLLTTEISEQEKVGMGIGLNYVRSVLDANYKDRARLEFRCEPGKSTTVVIVLPHPEEDNYAEGSHC